MGFAYNIVYDVFESIRATLNSRGKLYMENNRNTITNLQRISFRKIPQNFNKNNSS